MRGETTRRHFLRWSGAGAAALTVPALARRPGGIQVRQTAGTKRFAPGADLAWAPATGDLINLITIDTTITYQEIVGFGAAFTEASAYVINQLPPTARTAFMRELFDPAQLGISATRICIGSSDYATAAFSYDEGAPDPALTRFSVQRDRAYVIPELVQARRYNPNLFILATPWSPPSWMKNGGSLFGGNIKPVNFPIYAQYLVKFLQAYEAAGVRIDAISTQNETDTDQAGRMPASAWAQEQEVVFVGKHLGPAIAAAGLDTKILILDHNFNLWGRVYNTLEDPAVFKYADGIAWHPYVGSPAAMTRIHDAYPTKHAYWTEGGFELAAGSGKVEYAATPGPMTGGVPGKPAKQIDDPAAIARSGLGATNALRNWARTLIDWNVVLDEKGGPNIGPFDLYGTTTINAATKEITRGPNYWAIRHLNQAAARGAVVVKTSGSVQNVAHVAFVNSDGRKCVMLTNTGPESRVSIGQNGRSATVTLPGSSVTNLTWT